MANNRKINGGGLRTASDPNVSAPLFNFYAYETGKTYYNNSEQVDFVTYDGNLYVCTDFGGKYASEPTPERNGGFLMIVKKGEDGQQGLTGRPGIDGSTPEIKVRFEGKQLVIYDAATQTRLASSPELVGPTWKPVQKDNKITWKLEEGTPTSIDLDELRPKEEHPVLFRLNSDNTKRSDEETGPGYYIQWKREGNEEWTDLMSISELMNIALAGVSFWWADDENGATDANGNPVQRLHFGHKQVVRATYDASKLGNKRIAEVELGDVLFDAGEVPFANYDDDIAALNAFLCDLQGELDVLRNLIPNDYVKMVNGKRPNNNGEVVLDDYYDKDTSDARYLREHQPIKTLAGQSLVGRGDIGLKTVNGNTLLTVNPNGEDVKVGTVRSIKVNDNAAVTPDSNGMVQLNISGTGGTADAYTKAESDARFQPKGNYLTEHQSLAGLVKGVRVNNGGVNGPDGQGIVDITVGDGSQPVDTSDCVKSITINDITQTPNSNNNGHLVFTIEVGNLTSFDVKIDNNVLYKKVNGWEWVSCGEVEGGTGDGLTAAQVKSLIEQTLAGLLDPLNEYDNGKTGHNYFVRINELNSILNSYATKEWVLDKLSGGDSGTITHINYRTFTIYKWYSVDAVPSTPVLPTSASWDGTSNGLALVGNTNSWSDHPGNRPNDSTRLWMATITLQSDGTSSNDWNGPIDLTAYPGKDGNGVEFIYTLCVNEAAFKALTTPQAVHDDGRDDDYPAHWTDQPQSIGTYSAADNIETFYNFSENEEVLFRVEAASIRTSRNGEWGSYCKPFIWSMWGEDGMDGDGVEYIFFLADDDDVTASNNAYSLKSNLWPDNSWAYEYQAPNSGWKDDPTGVDSTNKYEFVSKRRYHVNPETRQGSWSNWSEPALWSIYKEGPVGPIGPDGVSITSQVRYYKANNQSTGVTAPNIDADPTLAANGSWLTTSNSMQLNENSPYLWFFERIIYSNGRKWQSDPVIIRYFNSAVNVDYQEIENNVLETISGDIDDLNERLSVIVDTNGEIITDGDNGLISVITNYTDDASQKSFADLVVDAKNADIKQWVGAEIWGPDSQKTLSSVGSELNAIDGKITNAATQAHDNAVAAARTEWSAADASITSTVTNATYVWVKNSNNDNPNDPEVKPYNGETTMSGYTKTLVANAMSAIKQESDKVSILVGQNGNVNAGVIVDAINGGEVTIDANRINLNGETFATAVKAVELSADQITSGTINANRIAANSITADKLASGAIATDHLTTSLSGGSTVDISGGLIKIKDSEERVRIIIGQESGDATPVLKFYDDDGSSSQLGTLLYDLGPGGIRHLGDIVEMPEITSYKFRRFTTKPQVGASFDWQNDGTEATLYKYKDGRRIVRIGANSGVEYWNPAIGQYQSSHSPIDEQYIASADATAPVSTTGFYVIAPYLWTTYSGSVEQAMLLDVRSGYSNFEGYIRVDCPDHSGVGTITKVYTRDEK